MKFEQEDIVICTVDRIIGATVFVKIDDSQKEGSIVLSEIAPGRIRNLREYVVPKKKIICKVLDPSTDPIRLSLRRVKDKEKKEKLEEAKLEKNCIGAIRSIMKEDTNELIKKIKENESLSSFLENCKKNQKELIELVGRENSKKILDIINSQKEKTIGVKKIIQLNSKQPNGLELIKKILSGESNFEVRYLGSGRYSLSLEGQDIKEANKTMEDFLSKIENFSKQNLITFKLE